MLIKNKPLSIVALTLLFGLFSTPSVWAQPVNANPAINTRLRSQMPFPNLELSNICGFAKGGREYALVGHSGGSTIVDVTNPDALVKIKDIPAVNSIWREIKVYKNFMYITTEARGQGLQIVNMSNLPDTTLAVKSMTQDSLNGLVEIRNIHALHIDTTKGMVYLFGGSSIVKDTLGNSLNVSGAVVLDIKTDPFNPKYVGYYRQTYIHDGYVDNDTLYGGHISNGFFSVIDFRNKKKPIELSRTNTPSTFTHNVWPTADKKALLTTDERANSYLASYDISNPRAPKLLDRIRSGSPFDSVAIVHNTHLLNDYAVTSWYTEGIIITDANRPQNLVNVGQYDSYLAASGGFHGCWGVYPFLPSGNLILSDIENGLFVVTPQYKRACYLEGNVIDSVTRQPLSGVLVKINSTDIDKRATSNATGNYATGQVTAGTFTATYTLAGYKPKTVSVNLTTGQVTTRNMELVKLGTAVKNTVSDDLNLSVSPNPFTQNLTVNFKLEDNAKASKLLIVNTLGQVLLTQNLSNTEGSISVGSDLSAGVYLLRIESADGKVSRTIRVVKQ